jgi:hypothetical protein
VPEYSAGFSDVITTFRTHEKNMAKTMGDDGITDVRLWDIQLGQLKGTRLEKYILLDASTKNKTG